MDRKIDHIELTDLNQVKIHSRDSRFNYEPLLSGHPQALDHSVLFLDKKMSYPIWISSMTGGIHEGKIINQRLALICKKYKLGMGLGSIRKLLDDETNFDTYDLRPTLGDTVPFLANLGIAQIEQILQNNQVNQLQKILNRLDVDGLMIHINPLQEWMQPGGDRFFIPPFITLEKIAKRLNRPIGVKEVGQGMGPKSIQKLLELPVRVFEFAAFGGTNFTQMELRRGNNSIYKQAMEPLVSVGHDAISMIDIFEKIGNRKGIQGCLKEIIISGGVSSWKDGMYLLDRFQKTAQRFGFKVVFGQASRFLEFAKISDEALDEYVMGLVDGIALYRSFLSMKENIE